ncbi:MAG TPA: Uma2 family endonuclease [Phycisphaerae bacterium]|jgi:Uma2 family endonuclease|nr:Uma2 family endonuclease [Phycisphaerae bacterium]
MSALSSVRMTSEQFLMMGEDPPGVKLELAHGEIMMSPSPNPRHSDVLVALIAILRPYIKRKKLGRLLLDTDTVFDVRNTRRPDLGFISAKRRKLVGEKAVRGAPDLCVEVLSPGTERVDRGDKFRLFEQHGVKHYWIFDPVERTVEAYSLVGKELVLKVMGRGQGVVTLPPFEDLRIRLAEVWPEE